MGNDSWGGSWGTSWLQSWYSEAQTAVVGGLSRNHYPRQYIYKDQAFTVSNKHEEHALYLHIESLIRESQPTPLKPAKIRKMAKKATKRIPAFKESNAIRFSDMPLQAMGAIPLHTIKAMDMDALGEDDEAMILMLMVA